MKTAQEWDSMDSDDANHRTRLAHIKEIQHDAWKQGMTDAAEIVGHDAIMQKRPTDWGILVQKYDEITAARDSKPNP